MFNWPIYGPLAVIGVVTWLARRNQHLSSIPGCIAMASEGNRRGAVKGLITGMFPPSKLSIMERPDLALKLLIDCQKRCTHVTDMTGDRNAEWCLTLDDLRSALDSMENAIAERTAGGKITAEFSHKRAEDERRFYDGKNRLLHMNRSAGV